MLHSNKTLSLTYSDVDNAVHVLSRDPDGTWTNEEVDSEPENLYGLVYGAIGEDDFIRLVYLYQNDYRFASNESGSWIVEHLNLGVSGGQIENVVVVDEIGNSHVVVYAYNGNPDPDPSGLYYLENSAGNWTRHLIEHNVIGPMSISLNYNAGENILTSMYDYGGDEALTVARFPRGFE